MTELLIHFDSPRQVQDVAGRSAERLPWLGDSLGVALTSRDTWLKIEGEEAAVARAKDFFDRLQVASRDGLALRRSQIDYALKAFLDGRLDDLNALHAARILVGNGKPAVYPQTFGQAAYVDAIRRHTCTFGVGPAGTGKTYLAMALAVSALVQNEVSRIILTRPALEAGEALGFLPGDVLQKILPYIRPLHDALYDMLEAEEARRYMDKGIIEIAPLAYMRGRTLSRCFVVLDEAQNTTREQMLMLLTRLGQESKCVVTGDLTQIDLSSTKTSGLTEALRVLEGVNGIAIHRLESADVVRHELVQRIIEAYARGRNGAEDRP